MRYGKLLDYLQRRVRWRDARSEVSKLIAELEKALSEQRGFTSEELLGMLKAKNTGVILFNVTHCSSKTAVCTLALMEEILYRSEGAPDKGIYRTLISAASLYGHAGRYKNSLTLFEEARGHPNANEGQIKGSIELVRKKQKASLR